MNKAAEDVWLEWAAMSRIIAMLLACLLSVGCDRTGTGDNEAVNNHEKLAPDVIEEISTHVRSGFYDKERLLEIFLEEMYEPGELDKDAVADAIDTQIAEWESSKKLWPDVTDCDRLDKAFEEMTKRGIIALQNAGFTQSDGYEDFRDVYEKHPNKMDVIGYCFYHGQDLERAVRGENLFVAFGPADPSDEERKGAQIGEIVREELEKAGLKVVWDGTSANRIQVPNMVWQRR